MHLVRVVNEENVKTGRRRSPNYYTNTLIPLHVRVSSSELTDYSVSFRHYTYTVAQTKEACDLRTRRGIRYGRNNNT